MQTNENFDRLMDAAIALAYQGCQTAKTSAGFSEAMELVATNKAQLDLRIQFGRSPKITAELIADGELVAVLFEIVAREPLAN